jgi:hypothetical protein
VAFLRQFTAPGGRCAGIAKSTSGYTWLGKVVAAAAAQMAPSFSHRPFKCHNFQYL